MAVYRPKYRDKNTGKQKVSKIYWYDVYYNGTRYNQSAKTSRKTIALEAERDKRLQLEKAISGIPVEKREKRIQSVSNLVKRYEDHYPINHREKSVLFIQSRLVHVKRLLGNTLRMDLTETAIRSYIKTRLDEGMSGRTINMELGELSRALGNPWSVLWPKVRKLEERKDVGKALSPEEETRLLATAAESTSKIIFPFIRIALFTGMRAGEIVSLRWGQVDLEKRIITVGRAKTSSGTGRQIPMHQDLFDVLTTHAEWFTRTFGSVKLDYCLFPFGKGRLPQDPTKPVTDITSAWHTVRKNAKVDCRLHDLRHTAATKMAEAGVPESTMLAIMGHMSRAMLERYSHIRMAAKRTAIEALATKRPNVEPAVVEEANPNGVPKVFPKVEGLGLIN